MDDSDDVVISTSVGLDATWVICVVCPRARASKNNQNIYYQTFKYKTYHFVLGFVSFLCLV
jgi:hypothetical protein